MKTGLLLGCILLAGVLAALAYSPAPAAVSAGKATPASLTVNIPAAADVSLAAEFPDENFNDSAFPFLNVDYWHLNGVLTYVRLFLIRFDLTTLPANAIIDSAALQLHPNSCTKPGTYPVSMGAFFVTSAWEEISVTYNTRPSWGTLGVNTQVGCYPDDPTTWYITSFVQAWQSDPVHNYGVKLSAPWTQGLDYSITFNSREYYGENLDPVLVITYHLPATPTSTSTDTPTSTSTSTQTSTSTGTKTPTLTPTLTPTEEPGASLYLPVIMKPLPSNCIEQLGNGGFETGALPPWFAVGDTGLGTGRISLYGGWLGGRNGSFGELDQWVTLPAGANPIRWQFWWKAEVSTAQPDDYLNVRIENEAGQETNLLTLRAEGTLNTWRQDSVDLGPYAGTRILVSFLVVTDGSMPTTFRVDDVSIRACGGG